MAGCCGVTIGDTIQNTQINIQVMQYLFELNQIYIAAGNDIDIAFPDTPDLFDSDPGDTGPEVAQRDLALCVAVESWVNETLNRGFSWMQSQTEEAAGIAAVGLAQPFIPVPVIVVALFGLGLVAGEVAQELTNDAYREYLACGIYEELKGKDTNSTADFFAAADNLPVRPPPPESILQDQARDIIEIWLRSQLNNIENYLGFIDTLNTAMTMAGAMDSNNCKCLATWSHSWLMGNGNQGDIAVDSFCNIIGSYNAVSDRWESLVTVPPGCLDSGAVSIKLTIPPGSNVTEARMRFAQHNEQVFGRWVKISSVDDWLQPGHVVHAEVLLSGVETDRLLTTTVAPGAATELFFSVMNRQTSPTSGRSKILQITLEGTGVDPFL